VSAAAKLDAMQEAEARDALRRVCGASRWVDGMLAERPFATDDALFGAAEAVWATMERADILEAFTHHPRIGANIDALREKFAATADWSAGEQARIAAASEATLVKLRDLNLRYEARFGYIFIVCATGKSADEMLDILKARIDHEPRAELAIAAADQSKITRLRLEKL
jgi:2-oxo-4-hydroxy-4-carboxy-5-ureidoimidazoline decarboxylase